jgi:hypothetical protein
MLTALMLVSAEAEDARKAVLPEPGAAEVVNELKTLPIRISVDMQPSSAATASFWERILTSNVTLTTLATLCLYLLKWASDRYKLDLERWEGVILHCYNEAENSGVLNKWKGHDKLAHAMQIFDDRFRSVFGADPSAKDREDARLDFARTAFNDASNPPKPA